MQQLGLSRADFLTYLDGLTRTHERRIELRVTDLDGNRPVTLEPFIMEGQVTVDAFATPTRTLTLEFLDPYRALSFDVGYTDAPVHRSRMIAVNDSRKIPGLGWVDCWCFTGPIVDYDRTDAQVSITAHGKEVQAMGARWTTRRWRKGTLKTNIIRTLLVSTGETRLNIPRLRNRTADKWTTVRGQQPSWPAAKRLAKSMGRQLFYDGRGIVNLRRIPEMPVHTFDVRWLLTPIRVLRNPDGMANIFRVVGGDPKGKRKRVMATVWLQKGHPDSTSRLARNGEPLRLLKQVQDSDLRTARACRREAVRLRDEAARTALEASADVLPVSCLDERDLVKLNDGSGSYVMRMDRWTLPLVGGNPMALGAIRHASDSGGYWRTGPRPITGLVVSGEDV